MPKRHFTPATFSFLRDLARNNNRDWFKENRERYLATVQEPALEFIIEFGKHLAGISPHFTADARVVGGSLFRIQRDIRFSKDKTPYKVNTGVQFRHESANDAHAPGFYLHLEPGASFAAAGAWKPPSSATLQIRRRIVDESEEWMRATRSKEFLQAWNLSGESLKRVPKGFDPDHPLIEDLMRSDFIASARLSQRRITSDGFIEDLASMYSRAGHMMRFLCTATDIPY